jgi:hypothetical protein
MKISVYKLEQYLHLFIETIIEVFSVKRTQYEFQCYF